VNDDVARTSTQERGSRMTGRICSAIRRGAKRKADARGGAMSAMLMFVVPECERRELGRSREVTGSLGAPPGRGRMRLPESQAARGMAA
jgi:hypothetical protein